MLDALDAEKFCSGHSEIVNREAIQVHVEQMEKRQKKRFLRKAFSVFQIGGFNVFQL